MKITTNLLKKLGADVVMIALYHNTKELHNIDLTSLTEIKVTNEKLFEDLCWLQSKLKNKFKLKKISYYEIPENSDCGGYTETYIFDDNGNRISAKYCNHETKYTYNDKGFLLSEKEKNGWKITYQYNDDGVLLSSITSDEQLKKYIYDNNGNLIKIERGYISAITNTEIYEHCDVFTYDVNGNCLTKKPSTGEVEEYTYDENNKIKTYKFINSDNSPSFLYEYNYNKHDILTSIIATDFIFDNKYTDIIDGKYNLNKFKYKK